MEPVIEYKKNIELDSGGDSFELSRQHALYRIDSGVSMTHPTLAAEAHRMHGLCYTEFGYFKPEALMEDGSLIAELDGTRDREDGSVEVQYLIARTKTGEPGASLRLIGVGHEGNIEALPTYEYFKDSFDPEVKQRLHAHIAEHGSASLREIAALSVSDRSHTAGSFELMRAIVQNALIQRERTGHFELYLASLTDTSLEPVAKFTGPRGFEIIGEKVRIFTEDPRANEIHVTPVLLNPYAVIDAIVDAIESSGKPDASLVRSFLFMVDGLTLEQMGAKSAELFARFTQ